jgi:hypothetical protein
MLVIYGSNQTWLIKLVTNLRENSVYMDFVFNYFLVLLLLYEAPDIVSYPVNTGQTTYRIIDNGTKF